MRGRKNRQEAAQGADFVKGTKDGENDFLLSVDELRGFKGLEQLSDEKAQAIIEAIEDFCNITYQLFVEQTTKKDE